MLSHTTLGTNNFQKAENFYTPILAAMNAQQIYKSDRMLFWGFEGSDNKFAISIPFDGNSATNGNGTMVAFTVESNEKVEEIYSIALKMGATSEGEPGERNEGDYYAAYFRDLDNNKIAIFHR